MTDKTAADSRASRSVDGSQPVSTATRVCFVSQQAYSLFDPECKAPFGGAELQMYLLARELARDASLDVHFVTQDFGQPRRQGIDGMTVWRYKRPFKGSRWLKPLRWGVAWVTSFTTLARCRADVYIESPAGFPTGQAAFWCRVSGARFVYRLASDGDLDGDILSLPGERAVYLWGLRRAHRLISRNEWQRRELSDRYGKPSTILPNGFDVPADPPELTTKSGVLWVASSQERKRPDVFLDLARQNPHVPFTMVMPKNDVAVHTRVRADAGSIRNLTVVDWVPREEIQAFFDAAQVFVNTSTVEGFPNTFVQAAMGATPVLSLSVNPDGILEREGFGRCSNDDVHRLEADTEALLADENLRCQMGLRGFEYARRTHSLSEVAPELRHILVDDVDPALRDS